MLMNTTCNVLEEMNCEGLTRTTVNYTSTLEVKDRSHIDISTLSSCVWFWYTIYKVNQPYLKYKLLLKPTTYRIWTRLLGKIICIIYEYFYTMTRCLF